MASTKFYLRLLPPPLLCTRESGPVLTQLHFRDISFCSLLQLLLTSPCPANPNPISCLRADINRCWLTTLCMYQYLYVHNFIQGLGQQTDKQTRAVNRAICKAKEEKDENLYDAAERARRVE